MNKRRYEDENCDRSVILQAFVFHTIYSCVCFLRFLTLGWLTFSSD